MIKTGDQVIFKEPMLRPEDGKIIRMGTVISMQGSKATVQFPVERTRRSIEVSELQLSSERFTGRSSMQANPVHRH